MKLPKTLPFDKFVSLTKTMFESNPLIVVWTTQWVIKSLSDLDIEDSMLCHNLFSKWCTITSIEVRLPQFSIWDTVMIVDTGEIWEIIEKDDEEVYISFSENNGGYSPYSQLVKIHTDLLPILQN